MQPTSDSYYNRMFTLNQATTAPPPIINTKPLPNIALATSIRRSQTQIVNTKPLPNIFPASSIRRKHTRLQRNSQSRYRVKPLHLRVSALQNGSVARSQRRPLASRASGSRLRTQLRADRHKYISEKKRTKSSARQRALDREKRRMRHPVSTTSSPSSSKPVTKVKRKTKSHQKCCRRHASSSHRPKSCKRAKSPEIN